MKSQLDNISKKVNLKIEEDFSKYDKKINSNIESFVKKDIFEKEIA
jgi:ribosomal protein S20